MYTSVPLLSQNPNDPTPSDPTKPVYEDGTPEGAAPVPFPPPPPEEAFSTPPSAYKLAAGETVSSAVRPIPKATQPKNTRADIVTQKTILYNRINSRGFLAEDLVSRVESELLRVGRVGRCGFNLGDKVLVKEELSDVRHISSSVCSIRVYCAVEVGQHVDMICTGSVVAWEQSRELGDSLSIGGLQTT
jgi:hypothetical protein